MRILESLTVVAVTLLCLATPQSVRCQIDGQTTDDLVRQSEAIVVARVTGVTSEWSSDKSRILTTVTLAIEEQLKGDGQGKEMIIHTLGGEVDGVGEVYSHLPIFKLNEQVIVFAERDDRGMFRVVGGMDGKMSLIVEESTGRRLVADSESLQMYTSRVKQIVQKQSKE